MKLFAAIFVLFVASFQIPYTAKCHDGGDVDSSESDVGLLRKDLRELRSELRRKSISDVKERKRRNNLKKRITKLETEVTNLKSEQASSQQVFRNLQEGLLTEKRLRQQLQKGLAELKTAIRLRGAELSEFQVAVVRNNTNQQRFCECPTRSQNSTGPKCDPCMPGLLGQEGETDRGGENGTRPERVSGLKCDPCMPGLPGQEGETDRGGENGTRPERVSVPEFRFTRADGVYPERVVIEAGGAAVREGPERAWGTTVLTDGLLGADRRVYWETRLDWSLKGSDLGSIWWSVGGVGVRREGSDFGAWPGWDDQSWAVWIVYNHSQKKWRYDCDHGGESIFQSTPVTATSPSGSHRLGFLLDPGAGTLTAMDANAYSRLYTFSLPTGDAGSQRLVPLVWFGNSDFERRFSLPGVDPSRLPGNVTDILQN